MNFIRDRILGKSVRLMLPFLAMVFVFSASFHNHTLLADSEPTLKTTDSEHHASHSMGDCSACLIQGNLKLPDVSTGLDSPIPLIVSDLEETEFLIPSSYLNLYKPSRSPPAV